MQWGERLAPLSDDEKSEGNRVHGCESQVWLVARQDAGHWSFRAGSDARLIRGLLALLLLRVEGLSSAELLVLTLTDFAFSDADTNSTLSKVKITQLETKGSLN